MDHKGYLSVPDLDGRSDLETREIGSYQQMVV
jgi:hypothetical protein